MDVLERPVGLVANRVEDIEMRDIGGQPHGEGATGCGLLGRQRCAQEAQEPGHHAQDDTHPDDGRDPCLTLSAVHLPASFRVPVCTGGLASDVRIGREGVLGDRVDGNTSHREGYCTCWCRWGQRTGMTPSACPADVPRLCEALVAPVADLHARVTLSTVCPHRVRCSSRTESTRSRIPPRGGQRRWARPAHTGGRTWPARA